MWLKILGPMMQQQGFRFPQSSLTMDTKAAVNSSIFPTTANVMHKRGKNQHLDFVELF
jgi:hypothetical protein